MDGSIMPPMVGNDSKCESYTSLGYYSIYMTYAKCGIMCQNNVLKLIFNYNELCVAIAFPSVDGLFFLCCQLTKNVPFDTVTYY